MKKIGEYTVRGQVVDAAVERIQLFDGRFDTGYRITKFCIYPDGNSSTQDCAGILATDSEALAGTTNADFSDNAQIGWSNVRVQDNFSAQGPLEIIDPDNMVIEDLFIQVRNNAGAGNFVNYLITMEKYELTEWKGALSMVRNRSQA